MEKQTKEVRILYSLSLYIASGTGIYLDLQLWKGTSRSRHFADMVSIKAAMIAGRPVINYAAND